ncbi:MAG: cupin domain-containing protein, partial [Hydrogenophaga sp.]|nr:cupin domain-containing protein [Hydrogenophaga sp.]
MNDLGRLEDLPADYVADLRALNLVPLWPSLRGVLPPNIPTRQTKATHWPYAGIRPLLLKAGELTLPGEWAPSHRHTPNAVRMVVEGEGAWTTVDGERCPMSRGDLILTPTGLWHEHGHDGTEPVVWLDVLDLPLAYYLEVSYHLNGTRQETKPGSGDRAYARAGVVPTPVFGRSGKRYPMLRYPWADAKAALVSLATDRPDLQAVQVTYVNPETGEDAENILGFHALMLRPGQTLTLPARSPACVYHVIEGAARVATDASAFDLVP